MSNEYTYIVSPDKMIINGISSDTVGIFVDTPPMPPMPEQKVEKFFVPGNAESRIYPTGQFEDITITVKCAVFDYGSHPDLIYKFLSGAKTLAFSSSDRYHYRVKSVQGLNPNYAKLGKNILNVKFICSPFKYLTENPAVVYERGESETKTIQVYNSGSVYCEPVFKVYGITHQAATVLTVNGTALTINQSLNGDTVYIDMQRKEVYQIENGAMVSVQRNTSGAWWDFIMPPGYSEISWATAETLTITKNERCI